MSNPLTPAQQLDANIAEWTLLKEWLTKGKAREAELRTIIAAQSFHSIKLPTGAYPEGTSNITVAGDSSNYRCKLGSTWKREVIEELVIPTLTEAQLTPDEQKGLIKMKPTLSVTVYRALSEDKRAVIDKMIDLKQGSITLDVNTLPK